MLFEQDSNKAYGVYTDWFYSRTGKEINWGLGSFVEEQEHPL